MRFLVIPMSMHNVYAYIFVCSSLVNFLISIQFAFSQAEPKIRENTSFFLFTAQGKIDKDIYVIVLNFLLTNWEVELY